MSIIPMFDCADFDALVIDANLRADGNVGALLKTSGNSDPAIPLRRLPLRPTESLRRRPQDVRQPHMPHPDQDDDEDDEKDDELDRLRPRVVEGHGLAVLRKRGPGRHRQRRTPARKVFQQIVHIVHIVSTMR